MSTEGIQQHLSDEGLQHSSQALSHLTDAAGDHAAAPTSHIHMPADVPETHSWIERHFPDAKLKGLENHYHFGNYVMDRKTGAKTWEAMSVYVRIGMHMLYYGSAQEKFLHWKKTEEYLENESRKMGKTYNSPESKAHIAPFIKSFQLESTLDQLEEPDPSKYANFNDFFARGLRTDAEGLPVPRTIADKGNDSVVSSVADCRLTAYPTIDLATKYWIKGSGFTVARLLGSAEAAAPFDGGSIVVHRLAPQDYHRWHAPVTGTVRSVHEIPGAYYTVNPQAINESGTLDVFCENRRSVQIVERSGGGGGSVAIVAVGAMLVGSIVYVNGMEKPGAEMKRGQCLGKFLFGGSTVITIFPKGMVTLDEDLVRNSEQEKCETLVAVGDRIGVSQ